jgi:hypothetical protein
MASHPNGPPPFFAPAHASATTTTTGGAPAPSRGPQLNLDDIFGDVVFTPDGDTVFLSEQAEDEILNSGETEVSTMASKPTGADGSFVPVQKAGGLYTTQLHDGSKPSLTMGAATSDGTAVAAVPFKHAPQLGHHLQYAAPTKKKSKDRSGKMSDQQKTDRRYVFLSLSSCLLAYSILV